MMVLYQRLPEQAKAGAAGATGGAVAGGSAEGGGSKPVATRPPESMESFLNVEPLEIRLGYGLVALADPGRGGDFLERLTGVRRGFAQSLGFIVPSVRLRDDLQLGVNDYRILLRGNLIGKGTLLPGMWLAMNVADRAGKLDGIPTVEPVFGLPAVWVTDVERKNAEMEGYTVVDAASVLVTHFQEVVRRHSHQLLTRQDVQALLDNLKQSQPALINDLVPGQLNAGQIQRILQNLLSERVSIRNLTVILERVSDGAVTTKNTDELGELVRRALGEEIVSPLLDEQGRIHAVTIEATLEEELAKGLRIGPVETVLNLPPGLAQALNQQLAGAVATLVSGGRTPVLLCSGALRLGLRRFYSPTYPDLVFIAYEEIPPRARIVSEASIRRAG
jgi:flagellar biosynthesis protein FlhA